MLQLFYCENSEPGVKFNPLQLVKDQCDIKSTNILSIDQAYFAEGLAARQRT